MEDDRIIEAWYFMETVEGISDIADFLHCKNEIENTGFDIWLKAQDLEEDFKTWIKKHFLDYK